MHRLSYLGWLETLWPVPQLGPDVLQSLLAAATGGPTLPGSRGLASLGRGRLQKHLLGTSLPGARLPGPP